MMMAPVDAAALRAQFPVFERFAYLNAGSAGPVPAAALEAAGAVARQASADGRAVGYFDGLVARRERRRAAYAALLGAPPDHVAGTTCTSAAVACGATGSGPRPGGEALP